MGSIIVTERNLPSLPMWVGSSLSNWIKLMTLKRKKVTVNTIPIILVTTIVIMFNSLLGIIEELLFRKKICSTDLIAPPIFIIGYWRTGTTHLHNLICLDDNFTYPTIYTTMFPHHFLLSERAVKNIISKLVPETRPMDNMLFSIDGPQEDEVGLALLTGLSYYVDFIFPDTEETHQKYLDFRNTTKEEREIFKKTFLRFLCKHTIREPKRIVLKSPSHSFRIKLLSDIFPEAKFIHIVRDPVRVFFSALHTFKILRNEIGLIQPDNSKLEEKIIRDMLYCYRRIWDDRALLAPNQFHTIFFEDLEKNPILEIRKVYENLQLSGFEQVHKKLVNYLVSIANYKKNVYDIPEDKKLQLLNTFSEILNVYDYPLYNA